MKGKHHEELSEVSVRERSDFAQYPIAPSAISHCVHGTRNTPLGVREGTHEELGVVRVRVGFECWVLGVYGLGVMEGTHHERSSSQFKNNCLAEMRSDSEEGSYFRLIDCCITQL